MNKTDLEPDICDLDSLAEIAERLVLEYVQAHPDEPERQRQGDLAATMVGVVRDHAAALKVKFYQAEGQQAGKAGQS